MKYEEIVDNVKLILKKANVSEYQDHLAVQFNIIGEGEGAFYIEIKDGIADVQPYEYYDRNVIVTLSADELFDLLGGNVDFLYDKSEEITPDAISSLKNVLILINTKKPSTKRKKKSKVDAQLEFSDATQTATEVADTSSNSEIQEPASEETPKKTRTRKSTTKKSTTSTKKTTSKKSNKNTEE